MNYGDKLKDPRWQKKRLLIFERDEWTCQSCGAKNMTLNVHHLKYFPGKEPWEYEDVYLITYCEKCHETEHLIGIQINESLLEIVQENSLFIKPLAQVCILTEKWPPFYSELKKFLNNSLINYLQFKSDAKPNAQGLD